MYQRPGKPATGSVVGEANPGYSADDGKERDHVFTHYFVGANVAVPGLNGDAEKSVMAEERLKNAAEIAIELKELATSVIKVRITNTGAGHYLPTGLTDVRQMWLEVTVKDINGKVLYSTGVVDKNKYLPEDVIIYNTVFGDKDKKPVSNVSKAVTIIKNKRIPPLESIVETIILPKEKYIDCTITARLLYRSASQKLLDTVMGKNSVNLPITIMATAENRVK